MKVKCKIPAAGEPGRVTLTPECSEDMWHCYNLVAEGDRCVRTRRRARRRDDWNCGPKTSFARCC